MSGMMRLMYASRSATPVLGAAPYLQPRMAALLWAEMSPIAVPQGVSGALYYGDGCFFQCIEGEPQQIEQVYQQLLRATPQQDIKVISKECIDRPLFHQAGSTYWAVERRVKQFVHAHNLKKLNPYELSPELAKQFLLTFEVSGHAIRVQPPRLLRRARLDPERLAKERALSGVTWLLCALFLICAVVLLWLVFAQL